MKKSYKIAIQCPKCGQDFPVDWNLPQGGAVRCRSCTVEYPITRGILDLRGNMPKKRKRGTETWDLDACDRGYGGPGYYENNWEWARRSGIPKIVEEYRYPRIKGWILDNMKVENGGLYLDVGCGVGMMFFKLKKRHPDIDFRMIGIDVSVAHLMPLAQRKEKEKARAILPMAGDAERLPLPSEMFDGIICSEVLEHILGKESAIREMARVLKPGGELFLTTPSRTAVRFWKIVFWLPRRIYRVAKGKGLRVSEGGAFDSPITASMLRRLVTRNGLYPEEFKRVVFLPHESYFQFFPDALGRSLVRIGALLEADPNGAFCWLGLHIRTSCHKEAAP